MDLDEFLHQPRVLKVILALANHPTPMTFRQFTEASGFWTETAAQLRDRMEAWNLIQVTWKDKKTLQIELTSYGREVVGKVVEITEIVARAMQAKARR